MPYSWCSRRRMDRRRCGPGGRKASWPRRNVRRDPGGGGGRRAPLAALSSSREGPAKPATGQPSHPGFVERRSKRMDGGTGLWRIVGSLTLGFVPDALHALQLAASSGPVRQGNGSRLSDADIIRRISGRARVAPPRCMASMHHNPPISEGKARVRPSGLTLSPNPGGMPARG